MEEIDASMHGFRLWRRVSGYAQEDASDLRQLLQSNHPLLLRPNPLDRKPRNNTERQEISAGKCQLYPTLQLSEDQRRAVLSLSDSFDISEFDALQLWITISSADNRRWFEAETGSQLSSALPAAARQWYMSQKECAIQTLTQLMKTRMDEDIACDMRAVIMTSTNRLLRDGVATHLLTSLRNALSEVQSCTGQRFKIFLETSVKQLSECLFFCFYQTQIVQSELQLLQELILLLSDTIASATTPSGAWAAAWNDSLLLVLQILQLTYVCALNQTAHLYSRDADVAPFTANEVGNAIVPNVEARIALEQQTWKCTMTKGFVCLVQAILRQPYVDVDEAPPGEVTSLLLEAVQLRAFTYIRLTMLPVVQAITNNDNQLFYVSVVSELLTNLLTMICLPVYADVGMPFPTSRHLHEQDVQWSNQQLGSGDVDNALSTTIIDCQDDFLSLLTATLELHPPFAAKFWQSGTHHPYIAHALGSIAHDSTLLAPVMRFLGAIANSTADVSVCEAVYALLKHRHFSQYDWAFFFHILESYATQLSADSEPGHDRASLSPADTEALTAICHLLEGVCRSCRVTENILASGYGPVERFFALLSCSVPPVLKGTLFRCLASLCNCSESDAAYDGIAKGLMEEIWTAMDNYKLLPTGGRPTLMPFGNKESAGTKQFFGLQYELEAIESSSGVYSVTDGFLSLVVALVQAGGVPGHLGHGQRVAGIVCYLEHVVEDILYKMHMRMYFPSGPAGESQRWRIVAKALTLLCSVVQAYEVNRLTLADVKNVKEKGTKRSDGIYEDDLLSTLALDFVFTPSTATGSTSSTLALSTVTKTTALQQFPLQKSAGFSVMSCLLSHGRKLLDYLLVLIRDNSPDALRSTRVEHVACVCRVAAEFISAVDFNAKDIPPEVIAAASSEPHVADGTFWRHKAVGAALGLIYECSIRENVYSTLLREGSNLSESRAILTIGNALYSSRLSELATSLSTSSLSIDNPLAIIASHASPATETIHCDPSIPVLALMIIEYVASKQSSRRLLSLIGESDGGLTASCVAALCSTVPATVYGYGTAVSVRRAPVVLPLGSRVCDIEDVFTAATSVQQGDDGSLSRQVQLREAVLQLLLTTLMPDRVCLTHQLLGLRDAVENNGAGAERCALPEPGAPLNCLDAVLDLLDPETSTPVSPSDSLLAMDPIAADMCLELLYRLAASPLTTRTVLSILRRRRGGSFYRNLLSIILITPATAKSVGIQIETAAINCCAWFLKIVALELRYLELHQDILIGRLTQMLQLLFQCEGGESSDVPIITLISSMQLDASLDINIDSPLAVQCLTSCATPCCISRGRPYDPRSEMTQSFSVVDVGAFVELMIASAPGGSRDDSGLKRSRESDAEGAEDIAIEFNVHNMRMACIAHVCQAWRQVIDIATVACGQLLLMLSSQCQIDSSSHALIELESAGKLPITPLGTSTVAHDILIPILKLLVAYPGMHMVLAEQISRTVLSLVSLLRGALGDDSSALASDLHRSLISGLIGAILRRGTASQARTSSSATYRGFLYASLINALRLSNFQTGEVGLDAASAELMDILGKDASGGPSTWRASAISCLNAVLCFTGRLMYAPDNRNNTSRLSVMSTPSRLGATSSTSKSTTFHHMILSLKSQGHLQKSFGNVGLTTASVPIPDDESGSNSAMMESLLSLCTTLCSVSEGVQMLMDFGTFDCINELPVVNPLALERREDNEFSIFQTTGSQDKNAVDDALAMMENLCRLFFAAASNHSSKRTLSYCLTFLNRHSQVVSHFLHFRVTSLRGLRIADMLVSLMCCVVACSPTVTFSSVDSPASRDANGSWDTQLGAKGDVFTMDICALMRAIGVSPIPRWNISTALTTRAYTSPKLWWQAVQPSSSHEALLREITRDSPCVITDMEAWTDFDAQLTRGGLLLLEHLTSFLRIRASQWVASASAQARLESMNTLTSHLDAVGLLSVDRESVTTTFCNIASLYLQLASLTNNDESSLIDEMQVSLLRATESLISAIHDMSLAMSEAEKSNWARQCREVADVCEKFPAQSFVRQTSLWIKG